MRFLRDGREVFGVLNADRGVALLGLDLMRTGDVIPLAEAQVGADYLAALRSKANELSALARGELTSVAGRSYEVVTLSDAGRRREFRYGRRSCDRGAGTQRLYLSLAMEYSRLRTVPAGAGSARRWPWECTDF